jgi:hypothetical protein
MGLMFAMGFIGAATDDAKYYIEARLLAVRSGDEATWSGFLGMASSAQHSTGARLAKPAR